MTPLVWRVNRPLVFDDFSGEPIESSNLMGEPFALSWPPLSGRRLDVHRHIGLCCLWQNQLLDERRTRPDEMLLFQVTFNVFEVYARKLRKLAQEIHTDPYSQMIFRKHTRPLCRNSRMNAMNSNAKREWRRQSKNCRSGMKKWKKNLKSWMLTSSKPMNK